MSGLRLDVPEPAFPSGSKRVYGEHLLLRAAARYRAGRFDPARVSAYLDEHASRFDLFDRDRTFSQIAGLTAVNGATEPVSLLIPQLASGNNVSNRAARQHRCAGAPSDA